MQKYKTISIVLCGALVVAPVSANAGLGGLAGGLGGIGRKLIGGNNEGVSSSDASSFLNGALKSTKNVMISAALLSQALKDRSQLAGRKAEIDAITNAQNFKELDSHRSTLESDLSVLSGQKDLAAGFVTSYQAGDANQKHLIALALGNLAIGVFRNVRLASQAPGMVSGIGGNPQLLTRLGEFKLAASLLGLQGKGLVKIGGTLPTVMSALKLKMPDQSETTEPTTVAI